ncbi:MAG: hypothetical protein HYU63_04445, partial [Armatimonadetes bacterium]|nr:hypothetical protein [Armatimonadota bacterium]
MKVKTSAPTRIDLAGGTLDIYPLYILTDGGLTVNMAINLRSFVEIEARPDSKIVINSEDLNESIEIQHIDSGIPQGGLDLIIRVLKFYHLPIGLNINTYNTAPKGSGLGASSSLLMALMGALEKINLREINLENLIEWGANLEAQNLHIPTGKQDYCAAIYGGVNALWFDIKGIKVEPLVLKEEDIKEFESYLILSFSGISHFSATHNWQMVKKFIDKEVPTVMSMKKIKATSYHMRDCILSKDYEKMARVLNEEWENRKNLALGVSNDKIEYLIEVAKIHGAWASKICGAGGGGCLITIAPPA